MNQPEGITILEPVIERFVYARPLQGDFARQVYEEVKRRVEKDFQGVQAFDPYFKFNEETGQINGSNIAYGILVNKALEEQGLWLPTIAQTKQLDAQGKLSEGVYRDLGIAVYSDDEPNRQVAQRIIQEVNKGEGKLPLLASIRNLGIEKRRDSQKINIILANEVGIISGEQAKQYLSEQFDYQGNSGACRVGRDGDGSWNADWYRLDNSNGDGRVDWLCDEATSADLEGVLLKEIDEEAKNRVDEINQKIIDARATAREILK